MKALEAARIRIERQRHHAELAKLATSVNPKNTQSGLQLWRTLRRIECRARTMATEYCNGTISPELWEQEKKCATAGVRKVFGGKLPPSFGVNGDPRGYALKLFASDDGSQPATAFALHEDWGRNQILAPEINLVTR